MDKIKNILSPNTVKDGSQNEPGRESGATTHSGGLTGEGSHLAQAHDTPAETISGLAGNQTSGATDTGAGSHLAQANDKPAGTTSGLTGNQATGVTDTSNTSGHDHLARDVTVAAGGAGLAEHEHRKHEDERGLGSTTTGVGAQNTQSFGNNHGVGDIQGPGTTQGVGNIQGTEYPSGTGYPSRHNDPPISESTGQAGYTGTNQGASHFTGPTGTAVPGPHTTDTANRLDPAVNTSATTGLEDAHQHSERHGGGGEAADKQHHLGRDAAIGGGVGAAAYEADKYHHQHQSQANDPNTLTSDNTSSSHHYGRDAGLGAGTVGAAGLAEHEHHKHDKDLTQAERDAKREHKHELKEEKKHQHELKEGKKEHHYGRDAAAATGAAGLAEHEHRKHENALSGNTSAADPSTKDASLLPGPAPNTAGPHKKDWMNKLDPRVDANPTSSDQYISGAPLGTSELPHRNVGSETSTNPPGHHLGRDTAVAGGVGAAAYEADKHHREHEGIQPTTGHSTNYPSTATGPQSSTVGGDTSKDHHYGRDAAVAGGVGGAAYEAEKHHKHDKDLTQAERDAKKEHKHELKEEKKHHHEEKEAQKDHHYGRDAAVAGGVGGAAYEADKHHKHDKDLTQAERDAKKEHKHELKEEKKHHHEEKEGKKGGLLGFLHRDKSKKYTPEEEAEFDRQEREHHDSHKGRDAGIATAGAAGGGALYESDKHHHAGETADTDKALPTAPGNNGIGTGAGTQNALAGDNTSSGHHYGRDAGLGAGAVGAAGVAEHEHDKHSGATPLAEKPKGKDLGDKLHGVDRNRGVPGSSGFPGTEGFGTGTGGALAASEATTDQTGHPIASHTGSGLGAGQTGQYDNTAASGLTQDPEYRKKDTTSGLLGSNTQSEYTGSTTTGVNEGADGRNRLHKDPPASHPASQGI